MNQEQWKKIGITNTRNVLMNCTLVNEVIKILFNTAAVVDDNGTCVYTCQLGGGNIFVEYKKETGGTIQVLAYCECGSSEFRRTDD